MIQGSLASPQMRHIIVKENGYNPDIILALNSKFPLAVEQTKNVRFSGDSLLAKGRAIFNYLRNQVRYKKDDSGRQVIQLPSRLLTDTKKGDCKSLALAAAAFMENNGFNNVRLRYASYNAGDRTPSHVYAVGSDESGNDIIIDPVYHQFNREVPYKYKQDYKMRIEVLSGIPEASSAKSAIIRQVKRMDPLQRAKQILLKLQPGSLSFNVVSNYIGRKEGVKFMGYGRDQQLAYQKQLQQRIPTLKNKFIRDLFIMEAKMIQDGIFMGTIFTRRSDSINGIQDEIGKLSLKKLKKKLKKISIKNITKGIKAVGLVVPRKSFLALVATNFRGLATRMSRLNDSDLNDLWVKKFGGKLSVLKNAIASGRKKKPLFGASKKIKAIQGIGYVVDESDGIGSPGVATAAIIASASPILVAIIRKIKSKGIPEVPESAAAGESGDFPESPGLAQDSKPGFLDYVGQALGIAQETGIIPDKPLSPAESSVDQALPGDDHSEASGSSFKINPLLVAGGLAVGAYFMFRKK